MSRQGQRSAGIPHTSSPLPLPSAPLKKNKKENNNSEVLPEERCNLTRLSRVCSIMASLMDIRPRRPDACAPLRGQSRNDSILSWCLSSQDQPTHIHHLAPVITQLATIGEGRKSAFTRKLRASTFSSTLFLQFTARYLNLKQRV